VSGGDLFAGRRKKKGSKSVSLTPKGKKRNHISRKKMSPHHWRGGKAPHLIPLMGGREGFIFLIICGNGSRKGEWGLLFKGERYCRKRKKKGMWYKII